MSKETKQEDIEFTSWANGGAALGRLADGRVVFAEGVLPGERARVSYIDREARFISADVIRILSKSPLRIEPRCPLFGHCAVCCMQNLEYPDQLHAKREILIDHLTRIAGIENAAVLVQPMLAAPSEWNYARTMHLGLDEDGNFCVPEKSGRLLKLEAYCPITAECLNEVLASFTFEPGSGIDEVEFRADDEDGIQLILRGDSDKPENEMENDTEISVVYQGKDSSWVMAGVSTLLQTSAGIKIAASDSSPFIENPEILDPLCEKLASILGSMDNISLVDIHSGTGFWSRWFAERCAAVSAQMEDEALCEDFVYNLDDLENVGLYIGSVTEILPGIPTAVDEWILVEAGSTGLSEADLIALSARNPQKIIYLCTDPAILARDLKRLSAQDRRLQTVLPYDPAPQTSTLGAIAIL